VQPAELSLAPLRDALLTESRAAAEATLRDARARAGEQVGEAQAEAEALAARAREAAEAVARASAARRAAAARQEARSLVLAARRRAYEELREAVLARVAHLRDEEGYAALLERLEADVRERLGPGTEIELDDQRGGIGAHNGSRTIDASLAALAESALAGLGPEIETLWA
jgi:vacuolar-type H+-ATPase subunit E/Vma4